MPTRHGILASFARAGAAVLRGFPTDCEIGDLDRLYWGLCTHVGTGVTQNCEAGLMHYVTDGELRPQDGARDLRAGNHLPLLRRREDGVPEVF